MINYDKFLRKSVTAIPPSGIRKFFDIAAEMENVISLGIGEPDFDTPVEAREAAIASISEKHTQYTSNQGQTELRLAISAYLKRRFGLDYSQNEILVTVGSSEAIDLAIRAVVGAGDEVIFPEPSYVSYAPCVTLAEGVSVPIKTYAENNFKLTARAIEEKITKRTKLVMLPFPANPTGAILERKDLEEIAEVIKKHDLLVLTDEVYAELTYEGEHASFAAIPGMKERTITTNGFSKGFCMTGWRIGYICCPAELMTAVKKIHQYVVMCAPTMGQYGAHATLKKGFGDDFATVKAIRAEFDKRRKYVIDRLNAMGLPCHNARGAFYAFPCVGSTGLSGDEFAERFLAEERVAVVPGSAFGTMTDYIRISYASSMSKLETALDKMENFVARLKK